MYRQASRVRLGLFSWIVMSIALPVYGGTPFDLEMSFQPENPHSSERFQIVVSGVASSPELEVALVTDGLIVLEFSGEGGILVPPPSPFEFMQEVGPLAEDIYLVEIRDAAFGGLLLSGELTVVSGGAVGIPTLSSAGLMTLVAGLALLGIAMLRRRGRTPANLRD